MRRIRLGGTVLLTLALAAGGCGDDGTGDTTDIGDPCQDHADCAGLCYEPGGSGEPYCTDDCDPGAADPCPAGFECDEVSGLGTICTAVGAAPGALGDPCADGADCLSGYCRGDVCSACEGDDDCPGANTCEDDLAGVGWFVCQGGEGELGDSCVGGFQCASGFCHTEVCSECEGDDDCPGEATCEDERDGVGYFVCLGSGDGDLGDPCLFGGDCASGYCQGDVCSECEGDGDCPGSSTCEDDLNGVGYFVCEGGSGGLGDPCAAGTDCDSGLCNTQVCSECEGDGDCTLNDTCEEDAGLGYFVCVFGLGDLGDPCATGADCHSGLCHGVVCSECEGDEDCPGANTCADDTGGAGYWVCEGGPGALGDTCQDGTDCASGYCYAIIGQDRCSECEQHADCAPNQECVYGIGDPYAVCEGTIDNGDACTADTDCLSGFCNTNVCAECNVDLDCPNGGSCVPDSGAGHHVCARGLGESCTTGADCNSGFCYDGILSDVCSECEGNADCGSGQSCYWNLGADWATCN